jgi:hypothetical protein
MTIDQCTPGTPVVYRAHPDARAEDGVVTGVATGGRLVFVHFVGDRAAKACDPATLERAR